MPKDKARAEAIKTSHTLIKNYSFQQGGISLNFGLNVKSKADMETFIALMHNATEELKHDIAQLS